MRKTKRSSLTTMVCILLAALTLTGCKGGAEDAGSADTAALTDGSVKDTENTDTSQKTEIPETGKEDLKEPETGSESETGKNYEEIYEPVLAEVLDIIYNGYDPEKVYEYTGDGIFETAMYLSQDEQLEKLGYLIKDISGDGQPELLLGYDSNWDGTGERSEVFNVYTIKDDDIHRTLDGWSRSGYIWLGDGSFYYAGSGGANSTSFGRAHLSEDGSETVWDEFYFESENNGKLRFYHNTDGLCDEESSEEMDITEDDFWRLFDQYQVKQLDWIPIGTHGSRADYATDAVEYFNIPGPGEGTVRVDTDGDGEAEEIGYTIVSDEYDDASGLTLSIDGRDYEITEGLDYYFAGYGLDCFWFRDDDPDKYVYLYVQYTSGGDYTSTAIYWFSNHGFVFLDDLDGMVKFHMYDKTGELIEVMPTDPDLFYVRHIEQKFGTQSYTERCHLNADGCPEFDDEYRYYIHGDEAYITALKTIPCIYLSTELTPYGEDSTIPKGAKVIPYRTDGNTFIDLKVEGTDGLYRLLTEQNGEGYWSLSIIDGLDGSNVLTDCFDGLVFAG